MVRNKTKPNRIKAFFKGIIIIAVIVWMFNFLFSTSYATILKQIIHTSKQGLVTLSLLEINFILIDSLTISLFVKRYRKNYSYREGLTVLLYGNFYKGITFGSGTKVAQIYLMNKQKVPPGISSGILTMQYVFHRIAIIVNATLLMIIFKPFQLFDFANYRVFIIAGYAVNFMAILVLVLLCVWKSFHDMILGLIEKVLIYFNKRDYLEEISKYFDELEKASHYLVEKLSWCVRVTLVNCIKLLCCYAMPYVIYISIVGRAPDATLMEVIALTAMMQLLIGAIPTPVGVGSTEIVYLILFATLFGQITASTTIIIYRLFTYYIPFLISVLFILWYNHMEERRQADKIEEKYIG